MLVFIQANRSFTVILLRLTCTACVACSRTLYTRASWSWYIPKTENSSRCNSTGGRRYRRTPPSGLSTKRCSQVCNRNNKCNQSVNQSINLFAKSRLHASETNSPSSWPPMIINTILNHNYNNKKAEWNDKSIKLNKQEKYSRSYYN